MPLPASKLSVFVAPPLPLLVALFALRRCTCACAFKTIKHRDSVCIREKHPHECNKRTIEHSWPPTYYDTCTRRSAYMHAQTCLHAYTIPKQTVQLTNSELDFVWAEIAAMLQWQTHACTNTYAHTHTWLFERLLTSRVWFVALDCEEEGAVPPYLPRHTVPFGCELVMSWILSKANLTFDTSLSGWW